ncbi:hypothetical protein C2E23DRAFT_851889 [Lenzites betulinus]|nr:hypothetical protein C2E23DRAFT_851889 [Lenzites betulinus]
MTTTPHLLMERDAMSDRMIRHQTSHQPRIHLTAPRRQPQHQEQRDLVCQTRSHRRRQCPTTAYHSTAKTDHTRANPIDKNNDSLQPMRVYTSR